MFSFALQRPYLHLLLTLVLGIMLGQRWPLPVMALAYDQPLLWLGLLSLAGIWWLWRGHPSWSAYVPGLVLLAAAGYVATSVAVSLPLSSPLPQYADWRQHTLAGRVASIPKYQRGHVRFMLDVDHVDGRGPAPYGLCYIFVKAGPDAAPDYTAQVSVAATIDEPAPALNRGQFDYRAYLLQRGAAASAYAETADQLRCTQPARLPWGQLSRLRQLLIGNLRQALPPEQAELAISVVYGDKITDLPEATSERFRRAGLTHILVASGTQVSLLIVLLATLFVRVRQDFTWRSLLANAGQFAATLAAVLLYAAVTGFETSIARALCMGVLVLLGKLLNREADGLTSLTQAGLILLLLNPLALGSPGFLLSFGATFGLIYAAGIGFPLIAQWSRWGRGVAQMLITTAGAQLFVAPIIIAQFQQVSLWGLFSNMAAIPTAFALLIAGGAASLGLGAVPVVGILATGAVRLLCWLLDGEARLFAALPGSSLAVPQPAWWWIAACFALFLLVGELIKARGKLGRDVLRYCIAGATVLCVVLAGGVLHWLLALHPELSALALPGGEGYIWRSHTGRTVLLLRSAGLERQHNADTVESALRFRGINRLHGIVWLDQPPEQPVLPFYRGPEYAAGGTVPAAWDLAWLRQGDACGGARLSLGGREVWLVWEPALAATVAEDASGIMEQQPELCVVSARAWGALPRELQSALAEREDAIKGGLPQRRAFGEAPAQADTELRIWPSTEGLRCDRFHARSR